MFITALASYSLEKNNYIMNIVITHTQNIIRGKRIGFPAVFTNIKILITVSSKKETFTDQFMNFK